MALRAWWLAVSAALMMSGCPSEPPPPAPTAFCSPAPRANPPMEDTIEAVGVTGQELVVELASPMGVCGVSSEFTKVVVELYDPSGAQAETSLTHVAYSRDSGVLTARLHFTPTMGGQWFLSTNFQPSLGRTHRTIWVAEDVRARRGGITEPLPFAPSTCAELWRTSTGAVLCQRTHEVVVVRGGVEVSTLAERDAQVVGDVVWTHAEDDRVLVRRRDTGHGPLVVEGRLDVGSPLSRVGASSTEIRAVRHNGQRLLGFAWDGSTLVQTASETLTGDAVFGATIIDADVAWLSAEKALCTWNLAIGDCVARGVGTPDLASANDESVLMHWGLAVGSRTVLVGRPLSRHTQTEVTLPRGWSFNVAGSALTHWPVLVSLDSNAPELVVRHGGGTAELFVVAERFDSVTSTGRWVVVFSGLDHEATFLDPTAW